MFRKTLCMILALAMLCTMLPAFSLFASAEIATNTVYKTGALAIREHVNGVDDNGVPKNTPIAYPDSFAWNDTDFNENQTDLIPSGKLHYMLIASTDANASNFSGTATQSGIQNPVLGGLANNSGAKGLRSGEMSATIVVPGTEAKTFQLVSVARGNGKLITVWVDGVQITNSIGANVRLMDWFDSGVATTNAEAMKANGYDPSPYLELCARWDWDRTVTLEPGVHTVKVKADTAVSGLYALLLTESVGYDWTQIHQITGVQGNVDSINNFAKTFGAAGYFDKTAPNAVTGIITKDNGYDNVTVQWTAPNNKTNSPYNHYAYTVELYDGSNKLDTKTVIDKTEVNFGDLNPDKTYQVAIKAMDMVGNTSTVANGNVQTKSAAASDQAYFGSSAAISAAPEQNEISIGWPQAQLGSAAPTSATISYNVYVDGKKTATVSENNYIVKDVKSETDYTVKVVPVLNGVEGTLSHLEKKVTTPSFAYKDGTMGDLLMSDDTLSTGWPDAGTDTAGFNGAYWNQPATANITSHYWFGSANESVEKTVTVPEAGDYYAVARAYAYYGGGHSNRYVEIKVDNVIQNKDTDNPKFTNFGRDNGDMLDDYAATPVTLTAGRHSLIATVRTGVVRVDYVALVPAKDYNDDDVVNADDIKYLLENTLTSRDNILEFFGYKDYMRDANVSITLNDSNEVEMKWTPNSLVKGDKTITYAVSVNGNVTKTYDYEGRSHTYKMSADAETGGLALGDNTIKLVMKKGSKEVYSKTVTVTIDSSSITNPYFAGGSLKLSFDANSTATEMATTLPLTWTKATVNGSTFDGSYNVYVNGKKKANVTTTSYTVKDVEPNTKYDVEIRIVLADGTELTEYVSTLHGSFTTAKAAKITVSNIKEDSATLTVTNLYDDKATYEVAVYGDAANADISGNVIAVKKLLSDTPYEVTVKATETTPYGDTITVVHDKVTFRTAAGTSGTLTYAEAPQIISSVLAEEQNVMGTDKGNTSGVWNYNTSDAYSGVYGQNGGHTWYANNGHSVTFTINAPEAGSYYVGVEAACHNSGNRYVSVTVNDIALDEKMCENQNNMTKQLSTKTVTLKKGANTVVVTANGGICRIDNVVFVSASKDHSAAKTQYINAGTPSALEAAFGNSSDFLSDNAVSATVLGTDNIMVNWTPNAVAKGKDLTFKVALNGGTPVTCNNAARRYTFTAADGIVLGTNTITVTATDGVASKTITKTVKVEALLSVKANLTKNADGLVESANITVTNPTGTVKKLKIMAVVYEGNRAVSFQVKDVDLLLSITADFTFAQPAYPIAQTQKTNAAKRQVKFFVVDAANGYLFNTFTY